MGINDDVVLSSPLRDGVEWGIEIRSVAEG
jgi:hypothetical protein